MSFLRKAFFSIAETLLRVIPFSCKTALIPIGQPNSDSPVVLTGNYHLTVERVKAALRGQNLYLLVANSRGVNVWCAATGGLFTHHDVISALKVSGIEEKVNHREVILPQLAATGIEARTIKHKTGWQVIWGPVNCRDIPLFLQNGLVKSKEMSEVTFPLMQRVEMAVAWAFPISLVLLPFFFFLWRSALLPLLAFVWGLSFLLFLFFPLYGDWLSQRQKSHNPGLILFDFGLLGVQLSLWGMLMAVLAAYHLYAGDLTGMLIVRWGVALLVVISILCMDILGSTPVTKSSLHPDRAYRVVLDLNKCRGIGFCEQVCPQSCFEVLKKERTASMPGADRCVQCGACVVQCPTDALFFQNSRGEIIPPQTVRKFKLNILGTRQSKG